LSYLLEVYFLALRYCVSDQLPCDLLSLNGFLALFAGSPGAPASGT
jgi:hypothetical protein